MATESEVLANLVAWAGDLPRWQQDALRRLATGASVDVDDLLTICRGQAEGQPFAAEHVRGGARQQDEVYLRQIHDAAHVNALAPQQRLSFRRAGLTIVYGDNGSGKSGYARILKKACRARAPGRNEEIIPDIYEANPGEPSAVIEYGVGGQNRTAIWRIGQPADAALSAVSVFDSRTANVHVDDANDVAYTPFPLKMLASLAQLCRSLKDKLVAECDQLKAQTPEAIKNPACKPCTAVGQLLVRLSHRTDIEEVERLSALSEAELARLAQLTSDLAGDPERSSGQLTALRDRLTTHLDRLDRLFASVSESNIEQLSALARSSDVSHRAASAASAELFRAEPLPHVGGEVWQALWESARAFSMECAYVGREYPVTEPGSVCVLCQQELTEAAADRLNRFESFIRDDSQQRAEAAKVALEQALSDFQDARLTMRQLLVLTSVIRDELGQVALAEDLRKEVTRALWYHRQIIRGRTHPRERIGTAYATELRPRLFDRAVQLDARASALLAEADSPQRLALVAEKDALSDRQWLGGIKADVCLEIGRLAEIFNLEGWQRDCATNRITAKSTEIAQELVTDNLRAQFMREVASFEIGGLAVELRQQGSVQGIPRFKVALTRSPAATVGQILSEGEHRCVALAAFMAELATTDSKSGIVFDDPVSSLDHMHREAVARRLISEATKRQVIIFTHDLAFLFELNRAAEAGDPLPEVSVCSVTRGAQKAGFCSAEPPFKSRKVAEITASLQRKLENERRHFEVGDEDEWRSTVKSISSALRDSWEIAVEEVVGHVIRRLSNKVRTDGLIKVTVIQAADCEAMRAGFERCSELLHSSARELNRPLPRPEEIVAAIDCLTIWADDLRQRQAALR